MSALLRFTTAILVAGSLVAACGGGAATVSLNPTTPPPTLAPTPVPTPWPTALPNGWAQVVMTGPITLVLENGGTTDVKTGLITGILANLTITSMSDPRANGTANVAETAQTDTAELGYLWATVTIENSGGSWTGTCRGIAYDSGNTSTMSCWLAGRGGYAGFTYAYTATNVGTVLTDWSGLIYRGSPPAA